jgi:hypothetical protein
MNASFGDGDIDLTRSLLHLGTNLELSFTIVRRNCTFKERFFDYLVHFSCVNSFHVYL